MAVILALRSRKPIPMPTKVTHTVIVKYRRKRKPAADAETSAENRKPDVIHE